MAHVNSPPHLTGLWPNGRVGTTRTEKKKTLNNDRIGLIFEETEQTFKINIFMSPDLEIFGPSQLAPSPHRPMAQWPSRDDAYWRKKKTFNNDRIGLIFEETEQTFKINILMSPDLEIFGPCPLAPSPHRPMAQCPSRDDTYWRKKKTLNNDRIGLIFQETEQTFKINIFMKKTFPL